MKTSKETELHRDQAEDAGFMSALAREQEARKQNHNLPVSTPEQDLAQLLYSYNPDLPMSPGMKAEFLALREKMDDATRAPTYRKHNHYFKDVSNLQSIDVYRVLELFSVANPCLQHAVKKLLVAGGRGAKDIQKDVQEAIDTLERWKEMDQELLCKDEGCDHAGTEHVCVPAKSVLRSWWDEGKEFALADGDVVGVVAETGVARYKHIPTGLEASCHGLTTHFANQKRALLVLTERVKASGWQPATASRDGLQP